MRLLLVLCLVVLAAVPARAEDPWRLPKTVVPLHYSIEIEPRAEELSFKGHETIDVDVRSATSRIVLNSLVNVSTAYLDGREVAAQSDTKQERLILPLEPPVAPGPHRLYIVFNGHFDTRAQGMYLVPNGSEAIVTTQMEPADCRRMFPCWDEPSFRATFQLNAIVPSGWMAVSNMPAESETPLGQDRKYVKFAATPPMPSYLVALVSGDMEALSDQAGDLPIRVITARGKSAQGAYALHVLQQILPYYHDYFGVAYPLPKLDLIALPDSHNGAMENWGCITFDESLLLYDAATSSHGTQDGIYNVVSHEVAHQWFGDLVTMAWWDDLWLNEAFADWMSARAEDHFNPDWHVWLRWHSSKERGMGLDALPATHPIRQPIHSPAEADSAFDEITYEKGASVLRMLEDWLGDDAFRNGLRSYIQAHALGNAVTDDLWKALSASSGRNVKAMAATWIDQPGFPLVTVDGGHLAQARFHSRSQALWQIPVRTEDTITMLTGLSGKIDRPFLKLNTGDVGFYRVRYEPARLQRLTAGAMRLSPADRLNLLGDTWALVAYGDLPVSDVLSLIHAVGPDRDLATWEDVLPDLFAIERLTRGTPSHTPWEAWCRGLLRPVLRDLAWEARPDEPVNTTRLRARIISALGVFDDPDVVLEARRRFAAGGLSGDLREAVVDVVGRHADATLWDELHQRGRNSTSQEEKQLYYDALTSVEDPQLAARTLALSLLSEPSPQLAPGLVLGVAGRHGEMALRFAQEHKATLLADLTVDGRQNFFPDLMATAFNDAARAAALDDSIPGRKAAARIRAAAAFRARLLPALATWLAHRKG